jgi:putative colanic acid biosynthesis UDP-glucose lipid carrier transferase
LTSSSRSQDDLLGLVRRLVDGGIVVLAHWLVCVAYRQTWDETHWIPSAIAVLVLWVAAETNGLYNLSSWGPWTEGQALLVSWAMVPAAISLLAFATKTSANYSRVVTIGWFVMTPVGLFAGRLITRAALRWARRHGWYIQRVAIAGSNQNVQALRAELTADAWHGVRIAGVFDDRLDPDRQPVPGQRPRGTFADLIEACKAGAIDVVYLNLPLAAQGRTAHLLRSLADSTATVFLVADFFTYDLMCARWRIVGRHPVVSVYDTPFRGLTAWLKRIEDIVVGGAIVALIALPMLLIAVAIKLTSPGPVFFRQRRYGLNGKSIRVLKFRTMTVCEDGPIITQARRNDPRVTRLGRFLRVSSLDELPQFLQVIRGDMSIVGPRPHAIAHNEEYRALIQGYMLRHKVKPGITGWAQVNGWRGETPELTMMAKRVQHDLHYIKNWSLLLDLKIIVLTIFGRRKKQNAY